MVKACLIKSNVVMDAIPPKVEDTGIGKGKKTAKGMMSHQMLLRLFAKMAAATGSTIK